MCSPGDHGWVIAGEIWPGQVLSFLRDPINASWRHVQARPCSVGAFEGLAAKPSLAHSREAPPSHKLLVNYSV